MNSLRKLIAYFIKYLLLLKSRGKSFQNWRLIIVIAWLFLDAYGSWSLSFVVYPSILSKIVKIEPPELPLYFSTVVGKTPYYFPNKKLYRSQYLSSLVDNDHLYHNVCDMVKYCTPNGQWIAIPLSLMPSQSPFMQNIPCIDVKNCLEEESTMSAMDRLAIYLNQHSEVRSGSISPQVLNQLGQQDIKLLPEDVQKDIRNPVAWGDSAKYVLFFFFFYLGVKLGKELRDFVRASLISHKND